MGGARGRIWSSMGVGTNQAWTPPPRRGLAVATLMLKGRDGVGVRSAGPDPFVGADAVVGDRAVAEALAAEAQVAELVAVAQAE
jgi:hypothetical protein